MAGGGIKFSSFQGSFLTKATWGKASTFVFLVRWNSQIGCGHDLLWEVTKLGEADPHPVVRSHEFASSNFVTPWSQPSNMPTSSLPQKNLEWIHESQLLGAFLSFWSTSSRNSLAISYPYEIPYSQDILKSTHKWQLLGAFLSFWITKKSKSPCPRILLWINF